MSRGIAVPIMRRRFDLSNTVVQRKEVTLAKVLKLPRGYFWKRGEKFVYVGSWES